MATPEIQSRVVILEIIRFSRLQIRRLGILTGAVNVLLPPAILVYAGIMNRPYWQLVSREDSVTDWFSSIQLLLIAMVAYLNNVVTNLERRFGVREVFPHGFVWSILAIGFLTLGLDERFGIHEVLRDEVFKPAGVLTESQSFVAGDVGLYLFFLIGLGFSWFLLEGLRRHRAALALYVAALNLTLAVIVIDSLRSSVMRGWELRYFWDYFFEEIGEIWAQYLFLLAFAIVLGARIGAIDTMPEGDEKQGTLGGGAETQDAGHGEHRNP